MKKCNYKVQIKTLLIGLISTIVLFVMMLFLVLTGLIRTEKTIENEGARAVSESIRRAAVSCYALEGSYPESYDYLKKQYNLKINDKLYEVQYTVFASNIMPEITVIRRQD